MLFSVTKTFALAVVTILTAAACQPSTGSSSMESPVVVVEEVSQSPGMNVGHASEAIVHQGYFIVRLGPSPASVPNNPAHVLISGAGLNLGTLLLQSAVVAAKRWNEIEPAHPVFIIAHNELGREATEARLREWGMRDIEFFPWKLSSSLLVDEIEALPTLRSLEVYSHSMKTVAYVGERMSGFTKGDPLLSRLRSRFDDRSFAMFHGCNAGWELAPWLAETWGIPVAGALTSSDLQHLHVSGDFYAFNEFTKPPGDWSPVNPSGFLTERSCAEGSCLRLKPDPFPYTGYWGQYKKGMGFYKFFCGALSDDVCASRMALSLLGWVATKNLKKNGTREEWKAVLADFMCPINHKFPMRPECLAQLDSIEQGGVQRYNPYLGPELSCDMRRCHEDQVPAALTGRSTFVREYQMYLRGLDLIGVQR